MNQPNISIPPKSSSSSTFGSSFLGASTFLAASTFLGASTLALGASYPKLAIYLNL